MNIDDIDIIDLDLYADGAPHDRFERLRKEAPVFWHKEPEGRGFWALTKYEDVVNVSRDSIAFASHVGGTQLQDLPRTDFRVSPDNLAAMEPGRHAHHRALLAKGFTPQAVERLVPFVRECMNKLIDDVIEKGTCDMIVDLGPASLPILVILEMMGVPEADRDYVLNLLMRILAPEDPDFATKPEERDAVTGAFLEYAHRLADQRRSSPKDDVLSMLMKAEVDGVQLSYMEFGLHFYLLLVAGFETTRSLIAHGMLALMQNPSELARVRADPSLIPGAIEETLRMSPPVTHFRRTATRDVELRGKKIAAGDKVVVWYVSANRDEDVFSNPHVFDAGRKPNNHVSFGYGPHFCIGTQLARLEARIAFEEILRRMPDMALDGPVTRLRSNWLSNIKRMPVRFTPSKRRALRAGS